MKQKGIALITVLLVVALATVLAVTMTTRQQLDIRRTTQVLNGEQAYLYALGAESWAKQILWRDEKSVDHLKELWANQLPPLPILGGQLQGKIEDLQGRFNLNNLILEGHQDKDLTLFKRLLKILDLPPQISQRVVDWIDSDTFPQSPEGAEDHVYLTKNPAYRTSNTLFSSPSELYLLMDKESYQKLSPYICTLPTATLVNVNAASAIMLMALVDGLNPEEADLLIAERDKKPFHRVQDFRVHHALAGLQVEEENISVSSEYFAFSVQVDIDKTQVYLESLLHRFPERIEIVMRSRGREF